MAIKRPGKKGKAYELEVINYLKALNPGSSGKRNLQSQGNNKGNPDIKIEGLDDLHLECKRTEAFKFKAYQDQAISEAAGKVPVIVHRFSRRDSWICMPLDDFTRASVNWLQWLGWTVLPP